MAYGKGKMKTALKKKMPAAKTKLKAKAKGKVKSALEERLADKEM